MSMVVTVRRDGKLRNLVSKGVIFVIGDNLQFIDSRNTMQSIPQCEVQEIRENEEERPDVYHLTADQQKKLKSLVAIRKSEKWVDVDEKRIITIAIDRFLRDKLAPYERG